MTCKEIQDFVFDMKDKTFNREARGYLNSAYCLIQMAFLNDENLPGEEVDGKCGY